MVVALASRVRVERAASRSNPVGRGGRPGSSAGSSSSSVFSSGAGASPAGAGSSSSRAGGSGACAVEASGGSPSASGGGASRASRLRWTPSTKSDRSIGSSFEPVDLVSSARTRSKPSKTWSTSWRGISHPRSWAAMSRFSVWWATRLTSAKPIILASPLRVWISRSSSSAASASPGARSSASMSRFMRSMRSRATARNFSMSAPMLIRSHPRYRPRRLRRPRRARGGRARWRRRSPRWSRRCRRC